MKMKGKSKTQKGITLIALIITIVVLLILATVAVSSIQNDGIIEYAKNVAKDYNQAVINEQQKLNEIMDYLNNGGSGGKIDVTDGATMFAKTTNTKIEDIYGNKITIPAGFKISVENTGYTKDTLDVTKGIVIEDKIGNQFVWIPCGTINHLDKDGKETTSTITLGRYSNFTATNGVYTPAQPTVDNPYTSEVLIDYEYTEHQPSSTTGNKKARNINDFYESVIGTAEKEGNGGYYLGRYEAGDSSHTTVASRTGTDGKSTAGTLVCKANQVPYNWILQADASSKCQSMYANGYSSGTFSSDLINSYAWDTAIIFIQTFGAKSNSKTYASTVGKSSIDTSAHQLTGTNRLLNVTNNPIDEQLNIYDMAGNCNEWSTETYSFTDYPCVYRGGYYCYSDVYASYRICYNTTNSDSASAFRPLLYVGL